MPELPDIEVYLWALRQRVLGQALNEIVLRNPFLLRSVEPTLGRVYGRRVTQTLRVGKRVVLGFEEEFYLVIHLMIAGRLHWQASAKKTLPRGALASFDFSSGRLVLTEAGTKRRASLHLLQGARALEQLDPGGIEPLAMDFERFRLQIQRENHTLKRALTDPKLFSGIGNAYSDEILHRARLSPFALSQDLSVEALEVLHHAIVTTLTTWTQALMQEAGEGFPQHVTAFREAMAVHGRYGKPCPDCGSPIQRIVYADNETNYCARCQTGGKILADRALSRLLKASWPRNIDEL